MDGTRCAERSQAKKAFGRLDGLLLLVRVDQPTLAAFTDLATVHGAMSDRALVEIGPEVIGLKWISPEVHEMRFEVVEAITTSQGDLPQAVRFDDGQVLAASAPWWAPGARRSWRRILVELGGTPMTVSGVELWSP